MHLRAKTIIILLCLTVLILVLAVFGYTMWRRYAYLESSSSAVPGAFPSSTAGSQQAVGAIPDVNPYKNIQKVNPFEDKRVNPFEGYRNPFE